MLTYPHAQAGNGGNQNANLAQTCLSRTSLASVTRINSSLGRMAMGQYERNASSVVTMWLDRILHVVMPSPEARTKSLYADSMMQVSIRSHVRVDSWIVADKETYSHVVGIYILFQSPGITARHVIRKDITAHRPSWMV